VETEAYTEDDAAAHTYRGKTKRNAPMFEEAGTIYIYFTYGMHYCMNIVTGPVGHGEAVLLRALEPLEGIDQMQLNRPGRPLSQLTNGPAKLVEALGIPPTLSGQHLGDSGLRLIPGSPSGSITKTTRIGISQARDLERRFYITDSPYVSRR
jgi:DNA-3-methyladenine glycosylase